MSEILCMRNNGSTIDRNVAPYLRRGGKHGAHRLAYYDQLLVVEMPADL